MIEITEIKKIGKGERYHLQTNEGYAGIFQAEILAKYKLKTRQTLDNDDFEKIRIENGNLSSFDKALTFLEHGMKTKKMIEDYLKKKAYPQECIEKTLDKLEEYGYINDEAFAQSYISTYSGTKGRKKLEYELLSKGVDKEIIERQIENLIEDEVEENNAFKVAQKYIKNKEQNQKNKQKLITHLVQKGFSFEISKRVLRRVENDWN